MKMLCAVMVVMAGVGLAAQRGRPSDAEVRQVMVAFARFVQDDKTEVVADEAMLKRVIAGDKTITPAEMPKLWASGARSQYVQDWLTVSKLREAILRIKSADGRRFGFVERIGDRYSVIVYGPQVADVPCFRVLGGTRVPFKKEYRDDDYATVGAAVASQWATKATQNSVRKEHCFAG